MKRHENEKGFYKTNQRLTEKESKQFAKNAGRVNL